MNVAHGGPGTPILSADQLTDDRLAGARAFHRRAQWRLDFVAAETSMGFHADQEAARILAEAIDYARRGQIDVQRSIK